LSHKSQERRLVVDSRHASTKLKLLNNGGSVALVVGRVHMQVELDPKEVLKFLEISLAAQGSKENKVMTILGQLVNRSISWGIRCAHLSQFDDSAG
jgi:hypothetical protein